VQFVLVAALMEWYLQTRTNSPINYKTISPPAGVQSAYRLPQDAERRRAFVVCAVVAAASRLICPGTFDRPHLPV